MTRVLGRITMKLEEARHACVMAYQTDFLTTTTYMLYSISDTRCLPLASLWNSLRYMLVFSQFDQLCFLPQGSYNTSVECQLPFVVSLGRAACISNQLISFSLLTNLSRVQFFLLPRSNGPDIDVWLQSHFKLAAIFQAQPRPRLDYSLWMLNRVLAYLIVLGIGYLD